MSGTSSLCVVSQFMSLSFPVPSPSPGCRLRRARPRAQPEQEGRQHEIEVFEWRGAPAHHPLAQGLWAEEAARRSSSRIPLRLTGEALLEDALSGEAIGRPVQCLTQDKVHRHSHEFFRLAGHFQDLKGRHGNRVVQRHKQVDVATWAGLPPCRRSKDVEPTDRVPFAERTECGTEPIGRERWREGLHGLRVAGMSVRFKQADSWHVCPAVS